jgi:hypothetical protein
MSGKLSMANLIAGAGALVTLLFSFFGFFKFGDDARSAWSSDGGAFATTVPAILALALLVVIGLELGGVKLPERVITFDWKQIKATWGIAAAGLMLSWIATDLGGLDKSAMFWLQVLGSIAMAVGTIMALLGKGSEMVAFPQSGGSGTTSTTTTAPQDVPPPPPGGGYSPPPPPPSTGGDAPPPPPPVP